MSFPDRRHPDAGAYAAAYRDETVRAWQSVDRAARMLDRAIRDRVKAASKQRISMRLPRYYGANSHGALDRNPPVCYLVADETPRIRDSGSSNARRLRR